MHIQTVALLEQAHKRAIKCRRKFGPHPSADFAACRVAEEAGELVQAATSMTRKEGFDFQTKIREEAIDTIAMVLRLVDEFPDGSPR